MKRLQAVRPGFKRNAVAILSVLLIGGLGPLWTAVSQAATNHAPTGKFGPLTCTWDATKNDDKYSIPASWSDADAAKSDPANAYLGTKNSKPNDPVAPDAIDGTSHNGLSYTWNLYRSTLTDSDWPIQLFVHDVGNPKAGIWIAKASVSQPICPAPPSSGGGGGGSSGGGGSKGGGSSKGSSGGASKPISIPSVSPPANTADAAVTAGTTGATLIVPGDNATSLHIAYGADGQINSSTADQTLNNATVTVELDSLTAKTTYTYQIVRTNSGGASTSASATFTTGGYAISLTFVNGSKAVSGLVGSINDPHNSKATSNEDGVMTFDNLTGGDYTVTVNYHGQQHALDYNTGTADTSDNTKPAVLSDTVDVSRFISTTAAGSSGTNPLVVILIVLFTLGALVTGVLWFLRRRKARAAYQRLLGNPGHDIIDHRMQQHFQQTAPAAPSPTVAATPHINESLRDMVIRSMHEQAVKKQPPPPTAAPPGPPPS